MNLKKKRKISYVRVLKAVMKVYVFAISQLLIRLLVLLVAIITTPRKIRRKMFRFFTARASRCLPKLRHNVVAFTNAARWELEPIGKYSSTIVGRIVRQQSMQSVLLFASASLPTVHLLVLVPANPIERPIVIFNQAKRGCKNVNYLRASFPMNVLLERI